MRKQFIANFGAQDVRDPPIGPSSSHHLSEQRTVSLSDKCVHPIDAALNDEMLDICKAGFQTGESRKLGQKVVERDLSDCSKVAVGQFQLHYGPVLIVSSAES